MDRRGNGTQEYRRMWMRVGLGTFGWRFGRDGGDAKLGRGSTRRWRYIVEIKERDRSVRSSRERQGRDRLCAAIGRVVGGGVVRRTRDGLCRKEAFVAETLGVASVQESSILGRRRWPLEKVVEGRRGSAAFVRGSRVGVGMGSSGVLDGDAGLLEWGGREVNMAEEAVESGLGASAFGVCGGQRRREGHGELSERAARQTRAQAQRRATDALANHADACGSVCPDRPRDPRRVASHPPAPVSPACDGRPLSADDRRHDISPFCAVYIYAQPVSALFHA